MSYVVIIPFAVKTRQGDLNLHPGQVITLAEQKAAKLIIEGKIKPIGEPKHDTLNDLLSYFEEKGKIRLIDEPKQQPEPQKPITREYEPSERDREFWTDKESESQSLSERTAIMGENCEPEQVEPFVTDFGVLVIPYNSDKKYHYWKGGQTFCDTLRELGRCDLIPKYRSIYSDN